MINSNKRLKKYAKMILALRGMKAVEKAAFGATYKTVWCAGPAIEHVHAIRPISSILKQLTSEYGHST
jgi:nitronate monooxygenase